MSARPIVHNGEAISELTNYITKQASYVPAQKLARSSQSSGIIIATIMGADATSPQEHIVVVTFSQTLSNYPEYLVDRFQ